MNHLLLTSIYNEIDKITFTRKTYYYKAKLICQALFNSIINDDGNFNSPKELPIGFFQSIVKRDGDLTPILRELKNAEILIDTNYCTGTNTKNGIKTKNQHKAYCKSYSFSKQLIYNHPVSFSTFKGINKVDDRVKFKNMKKNLSLVKIDNEAYKYIPQLVEKQLEEIIIGKEITNKMIKMKINKEEIIKPLVYWLSYATRCNVALIKFNDKFYLEGVKSFIERKRIELEISYTYSIEQIENGNFYAARNKTNNRLDTNFTQLKKELFQFVILDGEKTEEIDIINAQFAIMSNIPTFKIDENFRELAQKGQLYEYLMEQLNMTRDQVKNYLIVVSFGEAKNHPKELKNLFPVTMQTISDFKNQYGYEKFSVELQKGESNLMIDGVFSMLFKNKIPTISVHDSMRVKKSDYERSKRMMEDFFNEKDFKCSLKNK